MTLTAIILLILLGLILLLLEILVLPGMIVGIIGIALMIVGIASSYYNYNTSTGNYVLLGTILTSVVLIYFSFRSNTWEKIKLNSSIDGKVNTFDENLIKVGDRGISISRLAPMGKALINDLQVEVESQGFIHENIGIVVVKISQGKIIVKQIQEN